MKGKFPQIASQGLSISRHGLGLNSVDGLMRSLWFGATSLLNSGLVGFGREAVVKLKPPI